LMLRRGSQCVKTVTPVRRNFSLHHCVIQPEQRRPTNDRQGCSIRRYSVVRQQYCPLSVPSERFQGPFSVVLPAQRLERLAVGKP